MPSIAWNEPPDPRSPGGPNSEITPSMSTISSGRSSPDPFGACREAFPLEPTPAFGTRFPSGLADEESHKGSLARIQVGQGNLPGSIAASKASRRHRRWSLEPAGG
jgi:hypothetical protein